MKSNLPKVYQNKINIVDNNQKIYYSLIDDKKKKQVQKSTPPKISIQDFEDLELEDKLYYIMKSPKFIFNQRVEIKTKYETLATEITGRRENYIIIKENRLIPLKDIEDLKINEKKTLESGS